MAAKRPVAPDTPVRSFPTPNISDLVVVLDVDSRLPGYKPLEYGTPHPDQTRFPGAKLVYQEPLDGSDQFVRRLYATDRADQDAYNYAIKYSSGSPGHPIYIRTYVEPRRDYTPQSEGTPDPFFTDAFLVEEEMAPVEGELNSLYVRVSRVYETLPGPVVTSFETNEAGQKVTVTTQRKSTTGYNLPTATATSSPSAQAEDTGVVTEQIRSVPQVFEQATFTRSKEDLTPPKFRAAVNETVEERTLAGTAGMPDELESSELEKSEQQTSLFVKRVRLRERDTTTTATLEGETFTTELGGGTAEVIEEYGDSPTIAPGFGTISAEKENLGDGKFVTRSVVLAEPPMLTGQRYDESFDIVVPFTQQVVPSDTESLGDERMDIEPRDVHHSVLRAIDVEEARAKLLVEEWSVSAYVNMELPDVLESVTAVRTRAKSYGRADSTGNNYSLRASGSASETIDFRWRIRNGYTGPVPATRHVFFLDKTDASFETVAERVEAEAFPRLFPEAVVITSVSGSVTKDASVSASFGSESGASAGSGESFTSNLSSSVTTIPPTLHSSVNIGTVIVNLEDSGNATGAGKVVVNASSNVSFLGAFSVSNDAQNNPSTTIPATSPVVFPAGDYIVSIDTESYKYGLVRVTAVVAHVTEDYTGVS